MKAICQLCLAALTPKTNPIRRKDREARVDREIEQLIRLMAEHLNDEHPEESEECNADGLLFISVVISDLFEVDNLNYQTSRLESIEELMETLEDIRNPAGEEDSDVDPLEGEVVTLVPEEIKES